MTLAVRELPPLRMSIEAVAPSGRSYRWAEDEPDPVNVPSGLRHSSTMPGGHESFDCTLPRKPGVDYSDMERLTQINVWGASGDKAWEGRLERAPRVSGDQMAVSPSAVGYQAHLEDDKSASMIYIDRDISRWRGPSRSLEVSRIGNSRAYHAHQTQSDDAGTAPSISTEFIGDWAATSKPISEAWYDAGPGNLIGRVRATWTKGSTVDHTSAFWDWRVILTRTDDSFTGDLGTGNLRAAGPGTVDLASTATFRYVTLQHLFDQGPNGVVGLKYPIHWSLVRVYGDHDLPLPGGGLAEGVYASDVVAHAVSRWAPLLTATVGRTVLPSTFIIPQLAFPEPTTAGEIIRQATRFGLQDWAVWDDRTFWWHPRGAVGRSWRARIGPAQLEETGPQVDRMWSSVMVQYNDVDGTTRTVGPTGSGADTESALLKDNDPENPANALGITRREKLTMGVGTAASAIEVGRRFLEEAKQLDRSGRARLVGHVMDDRGVMHPYHRVRAGDTIVFVDAADASPRRIVKVDNDRATRTCSIDLDAPPEGLQALLERLGVVLQPLGL